MSDIMSSAYIGKSLDGGGESGIMEERKAVFGEGHRIVDNVPEGDSDSSGSGGAEQGKSGAQGGKNGAEAPVDSNGVSYKRPQLWLPKDEYAHVMGEINTRYDSNYKGKCIGFINLSNDEGYFSYRFEIHAYNEYNIFDKEEF